MRTILGHAKSMSLVFLVVATTLAISSSHVNVQALPGFGYDFTISTSSTLIRIQPGSSNGLSSGSMSVWVSTFCPNFSFGASQCDPSMIQVVNLHILGCPSTAYCVLDRTQVIPQPIGGLVPPAGTPTAGTAGSEFTIYSFTPIPPGVSTIIINATDRFGHSHSTQFGVLICNC